MKIKGLRIGNLVYGGFEYYEENSNYSVCLVTGLSEDQHLGEGWNFMLENTERTDVENYFEMKPIELTEEWLLKFGFNKVEYTFWIEGLAVHNNTPNEYYVLYEQNRTIIKHVHQLQNLYFALTCEELIIK